MVEQLPWYDEDAGKFVVEGYLDRLQCGTLCVRCGTRLQTGQIVFFRALPMQGCQAHEWWCLECCAVPIGEETLDMLQYQATRTRTEGERMAARAEGNEKIEAYAQRMLDAAAKLQKRADEARLPGANTVVQHSRPCRCTPFEHEETAG